MADDAINGAIAGGTAITGAAFTMAAASGSSIEVGKAGVTVDLTLNPTAAGTDWENPLEVV